MATWQANLVGTLMGFVVRGVSRWMSKWTDEWVWVVGGPVGLLVLDWVRMLFARFGWSDVDGV